MPRKIAFSDSISRVMAGYFAELDQAAHDPDQRVAWCSSVGPAELLRALGFHVYFPENHAAMIGASRRATDLIPAANAVGFSPEICSYLTSDIGAFLRGVTALSRAVPGITGVPRPDVLVFNTNQCRDIQDWFAYYGREFGVPVLGVASPRGVGEVTGELVDGVAAQLRSLVQPLEQIAGRRLDPQRLRHAVSVSRETSILWGSVLRTAMNRPAPLTFFDACTLMGPAVVLRGDQRAVDCYQGLLADLEGRVAGAVAAVPGERVRLYWEGMPIWGRIRDLSVLCQGLGAAVVASTYCSSWVFDALDPDQPFDSMARASLELFITRTDAVKERVLAAEALRFGVDGIVFHDARTCPANTNSRYGMPGRIESATGLPVVTIHGDLNDMRMVSDENVRLALEAFAEQLEPRGAS